MVGLGTGTWSWQMEAEISTKIPSSTALTVTLVRSFRNAMLVHKYLEQPYGH